MRSRRALLATAVAATLAAAGCAGTSDPDPRYRPTESVLEVVAVLRRHVPDDTYRFAPALDYTGRNVYRASLLRLENLEQVHAEALRAGHLDDVIAFAKGRALERLRAFDLAATSYRRAAEREGELRQDALRSAALCDALTEAAALQAGAGEAEGAPGSGGAAASLRRLDARTALLEALRPDVSGSHYAALIREEEERTDEERARLLVHARHADPEGDLRAVAALQQVVLAHRESKNANRHLLALADLYADLAVEYEQANPPVGLGFDPPTFEDLVSSATRLYEAVANQDGATERLEASRRLESFLAFTLRVDRDRFSR
jgi:hypothetical protein